MLLSRHPFAEKSGRGTMLRQRVEQARLRFEPRIIVFGAPAGDASDAGIEFLPMAKPASIALNALRLSGLPLQTWLYHTADVRERVAALAAECHAGAIYVDMLRLAPLARDVAPGAALIIDYDDLLSERYTQAASKSYEVMGFLAERVGPLAGVARAFARPLLRIEAARCATYEQAMLKHADLVLMTSPREAAVLAREGTHVIGAPPLVAPYPETPPPGGKLIFLGNLRYAENVSMLRALASAVAALEAQDLLAADVVIDVVGEHAPSLPADFDAHRFRFLGRAPDLAAFAGAGIFLAPVVGGSGVKLKVLDGMALGCPVVGTPKACEGLSVRANRDLIVAPDASGVLRAACAMRGRRALKAQLAANGRAYIEHVHAPALGNGIAAAMAEAAVRAAARQETV